MEIKNKIDFLLKAEKQTQTKNNPFFYFYTYVQEKNSARFFICLNFLVTLQEIVLLYDYLNGEKTENKHILTKIVLLDFINLFSDCSLGMLIVPLVYILTVLLFFTWAFAVGYSIKRHSTSRDKWHCPSNLGKVAKLGYSAQTLFLQLFFYPLIFGHSHRDGDCHSSHYLKHDLLFHCALVAVVAMKVFFFTFFSTFRFYIDQSKSMFRFVIFSKTSLKMGILKEILLMLCYTMSKHRLSHVFMAVLYLLVTLISLRRLFSRFSPSVTYFWAFFFTQTLCLCFFVTFFFMNQLSSEVTTTNKAIASIWSVLLSVFVSRYFYKRKSSRLSFDNFHQANSSTLLQYYNKIIYFLYLLSRSSNEDDSNKLIGQAKQHIRNCKIADCYCTRVLTDFEEENRQNLTKTQAFSSDSAVNTRSFFKLLHFICNYLLQRAEGAFELRLTLEILKSSLLDQILEQSYSAISEINSLKKTLKSTESLFEIFIQEVKVNRKLFSRSNSNEFENNLMKKMINYCYENEKLIAELKEICEVKSEILNKISFNTLKPQFDIEFERKCHRLAEIVVQLEGNLVNLKMLYPSAYDYLFVYCLFYLKVLGSKDKYNEMRMQFKNNFVKLAMNKNFEYVQRKNFYYSYEDFNSAAICICDGNMDNLGTITYVNDHFCTLVEYKKHEILHKSVDIFCPAYFDHVELMSRFYSSNSDYVLNRPRVIFFKTKNKVVVQSEFMVKLLPHMKKGIFFVGFAKKKKAIDSDERTECKILLGKDGTIYGFDSNFDNTFCVPHKYIHPSTQEIKDCNLDLLLQSETFASIKNKRLAVDGTSKLEIATFSRDNTSKLVGYKKVEFTLKKMNAYYVMSLFVVNQVNQSQTQLNYDEEESVLSIDNNSTPTAMSSINSRIVQESTGTARIQNEAVNSTIEKFRTPKKFRMFIGFIVSFIVLYLSCEIFKLFITLQEIDSNRDSLVLVNNIYKLNQNYNTVISTFIMLNVFKSNREQLRNNLKTQIDYISHEIVEFYQNNVGGNVEWNGNKIMTSYETEGYSVVEGKLTSRRVDLFNEINMTLEFISTNLEEKSINLLEINFNTELSFRQAEFAEIILTSVPLIRFLRKKEVQTSEFTPFRSRLDIGSFNLTILVSIVFICLSISSLYYFLLKLRKINYEIQFFFYIMSEESIASSLEEIAKFKEIAFKYEKNNIEDEVNELISEMNIRVSYIKRHIQDRMDIARQSHVVASSGNSLDIEEDIDKVIEVQDNVGVEVNSVQSRPSHHRKSSLNLKSDDFESIDVSVSEAKMLNNKKEPVKKVPSLRRQPSKKSENFKEEDRLTWLSETKKDYTRSIPLFRRYLLGFTQNTVLIVILLLLMGYPLSEYFLEDYFEGFNIDYLEFARTFDGNALISSNLIIKFMITYFEAYKISDEFEEYSGLLELTESENRLSFIHEEGLISQELVDFTNNIFEPKFCHEVVNELLEYESAVGKEELLEFAEYCDKTSKTNVLIERKVLYYNLNLILRRKAKMSNPEIRDVINSSEVVESVMNFTFLSSNQNLEFHRLFEAESKSNYNQLKMLILTVFLGFEVVLVFALLCAFWKFKEWLKVEVIKFVTLYNIIKSKIPEKDKELLEELNSFLKVLFN